MRCVVIGTSGAGKTTFARALAARLAVPCIELDALHWGEHWTPRPAPEFAESVRTVAAAEHWVVDGNYTVVRDVLWPRATHIVWLNFSRSVVFPRVIWRTLRRVVTREVLWAGNRESLRRAFLSKESILLWAFTTFRKNRVKFDSLRSGPDCAHLTWHELATPRAARAFLQTVAPVAPAARAARA